MFAVLEHTALAVRAAAALLATPRRPSKMVNRGAARLPDLLFKRSAQNERESAMADSLQRLSFDGLGD